MNNNELRLELLVEPKNYIYFFNGNIQLLFRQSYKKIIEIDVYSEYKKL